MRYLRAQQSLSFKLTAKISATCMWANTPVSQRRKSNSSLKKLRKLTTLYPQSSMKSMRELEDLLKTSRILLRLESTLPKSLLKQKSLRNQLENVWIFITSQMNSIMSSQTPTQIKSGGYSVLLRKQSQLSSLKARLLKSKRNNLLKQWRLSRKNSKKLLIILQLQQVDSTHSMT